jgi:hypothetical protein
MTTADRDVAIDIDIDDMVTADEMFTRRPAPTPWPSSGAVLALGIELLPTIADDLTADLVEHLLLALVDRDDALLAVRTVLSAALEQSHAHHVEIVRLRDRHHRLLDEYRHLRVQTLRQSEAA